MDLLNRLSQEFLRFAVEFIKLLPIMVFLFGFKLHSPKRCAIFGTYALAIMVVSIICGVEEYVPMYSYICTVLVMFIIRGSNCILYTLIAYFGICILDMLTATIWLFFNDNTYGQLTDEATYSFIINAINIITVVTICAASRTLALKRSYPLSQKISRIYLLMILLGEMSLLAFLTVFQLDKNAIEGSDKIMAIVLSVGSTIFLLTAIAMLSNYFSKNHYKNISQINERLVDSQSRYYAMLLHKEEETRKFRHDISNHLNCMRMLFENKKYNELNDYFGKIGAALLELHPQLQIGNDMIGAILKDISDKYAMVSLEIIGKMPPTLRLDNTDICTIFYNLFDNAFAAAENSDMKTVEISIKQLGENLFFVIKNTVPYKIEIVDNILQTDKQDKELHGFGTGNAVMCAEKNGGTLTYKCSDTHFEAELIIPNII